MTALNLHWAIGYNKDIIGGVQNLTNRYENRYEMVYAAAHTGVIFDTQKKKIRCLLQGHVNEITALAVSKCKRFIATADTGNDSMLVVWDTVLGTPIRTIFDPHPKGICALAFSKSGKYIASLSAEISASDLQEQREKEAAAAGIELDENLPPPVNSQGIAVWEWQKSTSALCSALITTQDPQLSVEFNEIDEHELATTGRHRVLFWEWEAGRPMQFYGPVVSAADFSSVRNLTYTKTIFIPNSSQAASATSEGHVVLWDASLIVDGLARPDERRAVKVLNLCSKAILEFVVEGNHIVAGCSDMAVRFFDPQLRILGWFEDLDSGPVSSISFEYVNPNASELDDQVVANASGEKPFDCPDFIVSTTQALAIEVQGVMFHGPSKKDRHGRNITVGLNSACKAMACHPKKPLVACGTATGSLLVWNYDERQLYGGTHASLSGRERSAQQAVSGKNGVTSNANPLSLILMASKLNWSSTVMTFSPNGKYLAIGYANGNVQIREALNKSLLLVFPNGEPLDTDSRSSSNAIHHVAFAPNSKLLAVAHEDRTVALYAYIDGIWMSAGKQVAHRGDIVGLTFTLADNGQPRLFSVGEDRLIIEYAVNISSNSNTLPVLGDPLPVESSAKPTGVLRHPPSLEFLLQQQQINNENALHGGHHSTPQQHVGSQLIVFTDEYKLRLWDLTSKRCRRTAQAPTYGGPVKYMCPVPPSNPTATEQLVAYAAGQRFAGLIMLPLDGNPAKSMGVIAHPGEITALAADYQGRYIFTCGGDDQTVLMWQVDPTPISAAAVLAGEGAAPYLSLLPGGADGEFYRDMADFFCYAQVKAQGENTTVARALTDRVAVSMLPDLLCAMGYFPTQSEIERLVAEVEAGDVPMDGSAPPDADKLQKVDSIDFPTFVRLFVNHRPIFSVDVNDIADALNALQKENSHSGGNKKGITIDTLKKLLTRHMEAFRDEELAQCLNALVGCDTFEQALLTQGSYMDDMDDDKGSNIVDPWKLAVDVLGLPGGEEEFQQEETAQ
eukprot:GDKJ01036055.1.p1 GENE.GDKJ01036055.1~~GDKJ01036055.1.p1  ORF type:complete len:1015 (-),score=215.92 GDKJ01036055.1:73-3117(-)